MDTGTGHDDPSANWDRRKSERLEVHAAAALEPMERPKGPSSSMFDVTVRDVGRTGVMFHSPKPLPVGSTWRLWLLHHGRPFTSTPIVVRYTMPAEGETDTHRVGCQFMLEPFFLARLLEVPEEQILCDDDQQTIQQEDRFTRCAPTA
jgi:hypothetical protein